jgi:aspartyl-tRNA(Asn)/glutamyl-tRNA(Gln) amidotransferase subunit C
LEFGSRNRESWRGELSGVICCGDADGGAAQIECDDALVRGQGGDGGLGGSVKTCHCALHKPIKESPMSVDDKTVRRVARLARIKVEEKDVPKLAAELNVILAFVEQLNEVNVDGVEPLTSVVAMEMKKRKDVVTDGSYAAAIVASTQSEDHFFMVPKVVE